MVEVAWVALGASQVGLVVEVAFLLGEGREEEACILPSYQGEEVQG